MLPKSCFYAIILVLEHRRAQYDNYTTGPAIFTSVALLQSSQTVLDLLLRKLSSGLGLTFARTGRTIVKPGGFNQLHRQSINISPIKTLTNY